MLEEFRLNHPVKFAELEFQIQEVVREVEEVIYLVRAEIQEQNR